MRSSSLASSALLIVAMLVADCAAVARSYTPMDFAEMAAAADLIVSGEIVGVTLPHIVLRIDDAIVGDPRAMGADEQGHLRVRGFSDWTCARRFASYKTGQRVVLFLEQSKQRGEAAYLSILSGGGEGEMPVVGTDAARRRVLLRQGTLPRHNYSLDPSVWRFGRLHAHSIDYGVFAKALRDYRSGFEFTRNPRRYRLPVARWTGTPESQEAFRRSSRLAASLAEYTHDPSPLRWSDLFSPADEVLPGCDASALSRFWRICEALQHDSAPAESDWQALFATPGYRVLQQHRDANSELRDLLPLALLPSRDDERQRMATPITPRARRIAYLRAAVARRGELTRFAIAPPERELRAAVRIAKKWLPETASDLCPPVISWVVFDRDTWTHERAVVDIALAADAGFFLPGMVGRALFLAMRERLRPPLNAAAPHELPLIAALDALHAGGVADHILDEDPVDSWPKETSWGLSGEHGDAHHRYREAHAQAETTLATLDGLLVEYLQRPTDAPAIAIALNGTLALDGRPVGFHTASVIATAFGDALLAEHAADPLAFLIDYQRAAKHLDVGFYEFSDEAMAAIDRLRAVDQERRLR